MSRSKYKNLVIIGNGFDRWQDLPTSYDHFRQYYSEHIAEVMADLGFSEYTMANRKGEEKTFTAVELVYGDPMNPEKMPKEFFGSFEVSLDKLDDQQLIQFFGRSKEGLNDLRKMVSEAQTLLRTTFCRWVQSLNISKKDTGFRFPKDCFFINFNYTDTLEKRFGVDPHDIYHIHGSAENADSIIVGHASHPETAYNELIEHHFMKPLNPDGRLPRFEGLYAIEEALYQTDKHVKDNIDQMCRALTDRGVHIEDIENIYVLGHSFGDPDMEYFEFLDQVTRCGCDYDSLSAAGQIDQGLMVMIASSEEDISDAILMQLIQLNIAYAIHHRERVFQDAPSLYPELDQMDKENGITYSEADAARAVKGRFLFEQAKRTRLLLEEIAKEKGLPQVPEGCHSVLGLSAYTDFPHDHRRRNAAWHISFFSPEDEKKIKWTMKKLGQKRYTVYKGIDACIAQMNPGGKRR